MSRKVYESVLTATPEEVWGFHASVEALPLLSPPGTKVTILSQDTRVVEGALHELRVVRFGFMALRWNARITDVEPPYRFVDTAERSPFKFWRHEHAFLPLPEGTMLRDTIEYELPFGPLGKLMDRLLVSRDLDQMFEHRHRVTRQALNRDL